MTIEAYPLHWPAGWTKITDNIYRDEGIFKLSLGNARDELIAEIHRLVGRYAPDPDIILSSNLRVKQDGLPYSVQRQPEDPGVAVYFTYRKAQRVFACDRYKKVEHNIRAIGLTIAALRGIERWGVSDMLERAFTGFQALPNPDAGENWRNVLNVGATADWGVIVNAYKMLRSIHHPDKPDGDGERFRAIQEAFKQAKEELGQ